MAENNLINLLEKFESKFIPEPNSGCWLWEGACNDTGYGYLWLAGKMVGAHRHAYNLYKGVIPPGANVLHTCDTRCCVNPNHLFLGTAQDNSLDMITKSRQAVGEECGNAKLTTEQVRSIRNDMRPSRKVAMDYGISKTNVLDIRRKRIWRHV